MRFVRSFLVFITAATVACAEPKPAIWAHSAWGDGGRSGQARVDGPRTTASMTNNNNWLTHLVKVRWRWQHSSSSSPSISFYYGAVDASGFIYYLDTGNGAGAHTVYKLDSSTGSLVWTSDPLPVPRYANYYGNEHLIVSPGDNVADAAFIIVVVGTTYTLADCASIARFDSATGNRDWWINGTATVYNSALSGDGSVLYLHFYNATVVAVDSKRGTVTHAWDLAASGVLAIGIAYSMSLVEGVVGAPPVLVFSAIGNFTAVDTATGERVWVISDPVEGEFASRPATPLGSSTVFASAGGNYLQGQGYSAIDAATGDTVWAFNTSGTLTSVALPVTQDRVWRFDRISSSNALTVLYANNGSRVMPQAYLSRELNFNFAASPVTSASGDCIYMFGSGSDDVQARCALASYCITISDTGAPAVVRELSARISGVNAPGRYRFVLGPHDGQVTVWHDAGVFVVEALIPEDPPLPPAPQAGVGEVVALVFAKVDSECLSSATAVMLVPAVLRAPNDGDISDWVLGDTVDVGLTGQCSVSGTAALDKGGRRAWVLFVCTDHLPCGTSTHRIASAATGSGHLQAASRDAHRPAYLRRSCVSGRTVFPRQRWSFKSALLHSASASVLNGSRRRPAACMPACQYW